MRFARPSLLVLFFFAVSASLVAQQTSTSSTQAQILLQGSLTSDSLPGPRLKPDAHGIVWVPAFTDLKLHDITADPNDPNVEPLDQNKPSGSAAFFAGNAKCLTRKLWGTANSGPFMHHGKFTTMREAVLAHSGEALASRKAFEALNAYERDSIIEFLKTLQALPPGTKGLVVDENAKQRTWQDSFH